MKKTYRIVPYGNEWAIRKDGTTKVISIHKSQKEAIAKGKLKGKIIVQRRNEIGKTNMPRYSISRWGGQDNAR